MYMNMILSLRGNLKFCARGIFLRELLSASQRKPGFVLEHYYSFIHFLALSAAGRKETVYLTC